jgi:hypothetical protein
VRCTVGTCPEGGLCPCRRKKGSNSWSQPWTGKNEQKKHLLLVARPPTSFFSSSCLPLSPKHHGPAAPIPPFLGDLPTSFHLPSGHRISSCLSRTSASPFCRLRLRSISLLHRNRYRHSPPLLGSLLPLRRLQTTSSATCIHRSAIQLLNEPDLRTKQYYLHCS